MYIVKGSSLLSSCAKVMPSIIDINGCLFSAIVFSMTLREKFNLAMASSLHSFAEVLYPVHDIGYGDLPSILP